MKLCVNCHHPVSQGDRHAVQSCPPSARGSDATRRSRKRAARRRARRERDFMPERGKTVAGTGVPKGAAK